MYVTQKYKNLNENWNQPKTKNINKYFNSI